MNQAVQDQFLTERKKEREEGKWKNGRENVRKRGRKRIVFLEASADRQAVSPGHFLARSKEGTLHHFSAMNTRTEAWPLTRALRSWFSPAARGQAAVRSWRWRTDSADIQA